VPPLDVVVGIQESLMFLVNSHILKMAAMLESSVSIIEESSHWTLSNGNNSVFWIPDINRLWRCNKIYGFRTVQRRFQYASEKESLERTHREDPAVVERAQALISDDPGQSLRKLASIVGVSELTMRQIVKENLWYTLNTFVQQMLSEDTRKPSCTLLLCSLKNETSRWIRFFSNERNFTVDAKINRRNEASFRTIPRMFLLLPERNFRQMFTCCVQWGCEEGVMPHFFKKGEIITKEMRLCVLMDVVKPWMETLLFGRPYIFQQDGSSTHTNHLIQNWLSDNVDMFWSKEFWPPNSSQI